MKYHWLKLKKDFFRRHDIKILERVGGERITLLYLKLLCESVDHNGYLRFSSEIPYTAESLSAVMDISGEDMKNALELLKEYKLLEIQEDGTIYMPKVEGMVGSASKNDNAIRQQRYRDRKKSEKKEEVKKEKKIEEKAEKKEDKTDYQTDFEEVWNKYPRKQGKTNALKSYIKARKDGTSQEDILQGLDNYIAYIEKNKVEEQFIKMGSTWFNQKCWVDNYDDNGRNKDTKGTASQSKDQERELDWFYN